MVDRQKRPHGDRESRRRSTRAKRNDESALVAWRLSRDAVVRLPRFHPDGAIIGVDPSGGEDTESDASA